MQQLKRENFNLTWTNESGLRNAERNGIKAILLEQAVITLDALDNAQSKAKLDALIERVRNNPALEAYFVIDEPSVQQFPALGRLVAYLQEKDPAHLPYINLLPCYADRGRLTTSWTSLTPYEDYLRDYMRIVKPRLLSYDHYRFYNHADSPEYFYNLAIVSRFAQHAGIPFMNVVQACKFTSHWRTPTATELRWFVYTTIAYGGKGIAYFLYWGPTKYGGIYQDGKPSANAAIVNDLNTHIARVSNAMAQKVFIAAYQTEPLPRGTAGFPVDSPARVTGGQFLVGFFGDANSKSPNNFIMVNRKHSRAAKGNVIFNYDVFVRRYNIESGEWERTISVAKNKSYSVELAAGDAAIFEFRRKPSY